MTLYVYYFLVSLSSLYVLFETTVYFEISLYAFTFEFFSLIVRL